MTKVYIVLRNADFIEGRGQMLFHSVWSDGEEAIKFVESQEGIHGSKQFVTRGEHGNYAHCNGYSIREVDLHESFKDHEVGRLLRLRETALKKLSDEEKEALGL